MSPEWICGGEPASRAGPPSPRGASVTVAAEIRAHVSRARLRPGDRLGREEDLARQFGVSRPTLREALRLLAGSHLIRASKGRGGGVFVAATPEEGIARTVSASVADMLSAEIVDIDELIESRLLLEVPIAGLAAQRANDDDAAERAMREHLVYVQDLVTVVRRMQSEAP
jgi:GntR family transcriptional repressor for pyruvate dehydrogenase complex